LQRDACHRFASVRHARRAPVDHIDIAVRSALV
jgi:hypothetical protein